MARLKGAVAVSPAFDFSIQPPHFALWSRLNLVHNLKAWACKHEVLRAGIPWDQLMAAKDVRAFDTVAVVAHYGYRDVDEYYSDASAKHVAGKVFVPTLALTADDDPVCSAKGVPGPDDMGPGLVSLATETGGHVAFAQGFLGWDSWQDQVVCDFLQSARDVASAAAT
jgi:abhydrolase domain-containing protein 1/3